MAPKALGKARAAGKPKLHTASPDAIAAVLAAMDLPPEVRAAMAQTMQARTVAAPGLPFAAPAPLGDLPLVDAVATQAANFEDLTDAQNGPYPACAQCA